MERVIAVFRHRARAEQIAQEVERLDLGDVSIRIEDRRMTDDEPQAPPAPAVDDVERTRDKQVAGHVFKNAVGLSALYAAAGAAAGALLGWVFSEPGTLWFWAALVVGAVTGTVLGAIQGGIGAAMDESEREEATLLVVDAGSETSARRVETVLRRAEPERVERSPGPDRLAG